MSEKLTVKEMSNRLKNIEETIFDLMKAAGTEDDNVEKLDVSDYSLSDGLMFKCEYGNILYHLAESAAYIKWMRKYLLRPIEKESILYKNHKGRYECEFCEFTTGQIIEVLLYDVQLDQERWVISNIEYSHVMQDYYVAGLPNASLEGAKVRLRK